MTQMESARKGIVTGAIKDVASEENVSEEKVLAAVAVLSHQALGIFLRKNARFASILNAASVHNSQNLRDMHRKCCR